MEKVVNLLIFVDISSISSNEAQYARLIGLLYRPSNESLQIIQLEKQDN